jgi:multiple sugar transport system permease protein
MKLSKIQKTIVYFFLIVLSLYFLVPFIWMILTSFKTETEAMMYPPKALPNIWKLSNFSDAWKSQPFGLYLWNSVVVTILSTAGTLISVSLVAYGFARYNFKGRNILFMVLLATMMIPWDVTMIPLYMEFKLLGWINTLKPLIIPSFFGSAYYIFLLRQFLMGIPKDFEEAARIDGANDFQIFFKIFVPMMKAPLILIGVLNMMSVWNDYLGPLIFLQSSSKYTLPLGLAAFKGAHSVNIIPIMAITALMVIPPIVAFAFAQKYIVEGVSGGIKG